MLPLVFCVRAVAIQPGANAAMMIAVAVAAGVLGRARRRLMRAVR
jgi:hypothetical protein